MGIRLPVPRPHEQTVRVERLRSLRTGACSSPKRVGGPGRATGHPDNTAAARNGPRSQLIGLALEVVVASTPALARNTGHPSGRLASSYGRSPAISDTKTTWNAGARNVRTSPSPDRAPAFPFPAGVVHPARASGSKPARAAAARCCAARLRRGRPQCGRRPA